MRMIRKSVDGRMSSSADPLPPEMWAYSTPEMLRFVAGEAARIEPTGQPIIDIDPNESYGEEVMTPRRVDAIRRAAQNHGESGKNLLKLLGI